jgi:hypothetical protein
VLVEQIQHTLSDEEEMRLRKVKTLADRSADVIYEPKNRNKKEAGLGVPTSFLT